MRSSPRLMTLGSLAAAALLAACDDAKPERGSISIAANSTATISTATPVAAAPTAPTTTPTDIAEIIKHDTIEPDPGPPPRDPNPPRLTARPVDFTPPPLPPELLDDGGLKPLPTRRPPSTNPAR